MFTALPAHTALSLVLTRGWKVNYGDCLKLPNGEKPFSAQQLGEPDGQIFQ